MLGVILALVVGAGLPASPDPASLVGELGSPRYLRREAAEAALAGLGRRAVPALRAATGAKDPEVRVRAAAILGRIEGALVVEPTPIPLDFRDAPIDEVLRAINLRTGLSLRLDPGGEPIEPAPRLTLRAAEPLAFWKGVDALCEAGRLHYAFGVPPAAGPGDPAFPLHPGYLPPPEPVSDSGPFRTHLASVHYQSEILMSPARANSLSDHPPGSRPVAARQFYLQFVIAAEPRLSITQNGAPRVVEAVDDRGGSLLIPAEGASSQHSSGYFGMNPSPLVRFRADLAYPEGPGRRIRRLRGVMPLIAAARKPDPLKVPLDGAIGRTFRSPDVEITIREVRPAGDGRSTIELTLKPLGGPAGNVPEVDPLAARMESPQQQLEVVGADGVPIPWFPAGSFFEGEETRLTLSLHGRGGPVAPKAIVYHGMTRVATEVPFEFRDVPIP